MSPECPDGEKCTAYSTEPGYWNVDAAKCVPIIGTKQRGEVCTRYAENDDCDEGLFCMPETTPGDTGPGVCMEFCLHADDHADMCPDGFFCPAAGDTVLYLCYQKCHPLLQDCPHDWACYYYRHDVFLCSLAAGAGNDGDECGGGWNCVPGLDCVPAEDLWGCEDNYGCCTPLCDLDAGDPHALCDIANGEACQPWYEPGAAPPGLQNVGYCGLPP
jgi:hypothetical protein